LDKPGGPIIEGASAVVGGIIVGDVFSDITLNAWRQIKSTYAEETRNKVREDSRRIDPLVIDLDGDGIKLVNINKSNAMFDLTGSGFANKSGWISSGDAFWVG
jgi:hypothetical protein